MNAMSHDNDYYSGNGMKKKMNPALKVFLVLFLIGAAAVAAAGAFLDSENFQKVILHRLQQCLLPSFILACFSAALC